MENKTREIQLRCLNILRCVDKICRSNNIQYSLCGGSVVGAHLYNGCLAWDDDIDLMMTRENYEKFIKCAQQFLPQEYVLQNYAVCDDFVSTFTKIVDKNTTVVQQDGTVSGVFLDITVYDKIPRKNRKKIFFQWKLLQVKLRGKRKTHRIKDFIENCIVFLSPKDKRKNLKKFQKKIEKLGQGIKEYDSAELFGAYCNTKLYKPHIFENYTEILFEGEKYMIVKDYVEYLENRYERTNFYVSEEEKVAPHYKYVDFNIPYKEFQKNGRQF